MDNNIISELVNQIEAIRKAGYVAKSINTVTKEGDTQTIIIPKGMAKDKAAQELLNQYKEEETVITYQERFESWHWQDVLVAVKKVSEQMFGWVNAKGSMFSSPTEIRVHTGFKSDGTKTFEDCYYGHFEVAQWDKAKAQTAVDKQGKVHIIFDLKKKFKSYAADYFAAIHLYLGEHSIYRGKSVVLDGNEFTLFQPQGNDKIILNEGEELTVKNFILAPLGLAKKKRIYLFTGPYGTGKTETAIRVAEEANKRGMVFFYCKTAKSFTHALTLVKNYQPAVLFLEDIESIAGGEDRTEELNDLLNTLDGVETKGSNLTVIFTTNHPEKITAAMRRPGRIDLIVNFEKADEVSREKIYRRYFEHMAGAKNLDYADLAARTPTIQGAVVAEISNRAITLAEQINKKIITQDIVRSSIASMQYQIDFMERKLEDTESAADKAAYWTEKARQEASDALDN